MYINSNENTGKLCTSVSDRKVLLNIVYYRNESINVWAAASCSLIVPKEALKSEQQNKNIDSNMTFQSCYKELRLTEANENPVKLLRHVQSHEMAKPAGCY